MRALPRQVWHSLTGSRAPDAPGSNRPTKEKNTYEYRIRYEGERYYHPYLIEARVVGTRKWSVVAAGQSFESAVSQMDYLKSLVEKGLCLV